MHWCTGTKLQKYLQLTSARAYKLRSYLRRPAVWLAERSPAPRRRVIAIARERKTLGHMASRDYQEALKTVIVVGAGAAGLEAARVLLGHDAHRKGEVSVILLEARNRVGGRMCTDRRWGVPFDLGLSVFVR
jgi:NADPH-dependent 2,4-dienoyl-CoA reductase/sulfur reductase-like enzyme